MTEPALIIRPMAEGCGRTLQGSLGQQETLELEVFGVKRWEELTGGRQTEWNQSVV